MGSKQKTTYFREVYVELVEALTQVKELFQRRIISLKATRKNRAEGGCDVRLQDGMIQGYSQCIEMIDMELGD